jgi:hypothetical protein
MKLGDIMTVREFKRKYMIWGLSIAAFLIVLSIALAFWQEEKDYAFYGIVGTLFGFFLGIPVSIFIVSEKEVKEDKKAKSKEVVVPEPKVEVEFTETLEPEKVETVEKVTIISTQEDIPTKTEKEEINEKINEIIFDSMTVIQLRDYAKSKGLSGYTTLKKSELVELLKTQE